MWYFKEVVLYFEEVLLYPGLQVNTTLSLVLCLLNNNVRFCFINNLYEFLLFQSIIYNNRFVEPFLRYLREDCFTAVNVLSFLSVLRNFVVI